VQPIGAFRNHLAAAEISREITSPATAENLGRLVDRMESIARQFRFFVRGREEPKATVDLGTVLDDTVRLLAPEIAAAKIALYSTPIDTPVLLHAHKVQLEQVFTNLLKNAMQAMEYTDDPQIRIGVTTGPASVEIRVADNGPGTAGTSLSELQEPFFSTKPSGVGMGLGLAIATEIIKDHGGDLHLGSVSQGAEFIITLPLERAGDTT
jgi:two-component system C4-dicarboxylate transport sensor histidine kinase DctB